MAEMTQAQAKYARQRAQDIYSVKKQALEQQLSIKQRTLTLTEKLDRIRKCDFRIREIDPYDRQWYGNSVEPYLVFESPEPEVKVDKEAIQEKLRTLKTDYNNLCDELMLGDNAEALKLLKAFEAN